MDNLPSLFLFFLQFQIVSNTAKMHNLSYLVPFFSAVLDLFKYSHNACFREIVLLFSAVLNRLKSRRNACLSYIAVIYFSAVLNRLKSRRNACLSYIAVIYFSAVPIRFNYHQASECML